MKHYFLRVLLLGLLGIHLGVSASQMLRFDLPEQPIQSGLIEFGLQARITLIVDQNLIAGQRTGEVIGTLAIDDALQKLLANTDLIARYIPESQSWFLQKKPQADASPVAVENPIIENKNTIEEINIIGRLNYPLRYNTVTNTQLQAGMSYFDSSRFLNVIPRTLIEDQQSNDMFDAIKYASGISSSDGLNDSNDDVYIRGFSRHSIYQDGFRLGDSLGSKILPANIERVEIIKGPSTLLYGQAEPGGVINFVRKRAEKESFGRFEAGVGSYGKQLLQLDLNNPVQMIDNLDYRLILSSEQKNEEAEIDDLQRQLISASTTYHIGSDTNVSFHYDFQHSEQTDPRDFVVATEFEDADGDVFPGATLADGIRTRHAGFTSDLKMFSAEFSHYFASDWRLLLKYNWLNEERVGVRTAVDTLLNTNGLVNPQVTFDTVFIFGAQLLIPIDVIEGADDIYYNIRPIRSLYDEAGYETANRFGLTTEGSFDLGNYKHHVIMGMDWHQQDLYKGYIVEERRVFPGVLLPDSEFEYYFANIMNDIFNPERSLGSLSSQEMRLLYDDYGAFIQDSIELNNQWVVNAGTRLVLMKGEYENITSGELYNLQDYEYLSSQLGVVYRYSDHYSWYANYSEALRANYHLDDVGSEAVDPELSNQFEVGVKSLLNNGRFLSSLSLFQIDKDNVVDHVIDQPLRTSLGLYSVRVSGIDMDFTWQLNSRWDLMGAVSFINSEFISGPYAGEKPNVAADQLVSFFIHHQYNDALAFNVGVNYVGERESHNRTVSDASSTDQIDTVFYMPAYVTTDLSVVYQADSVRFNPKWKLLIKNLTDTEYYSSTVTSVRENFAEGRFIQLSMEIGF